MQVVPGMARDGHRSGLRRMTQVTVAACLADLLPAVGLYEVDDGADLHTYGP
jgi:hypothetical protein